ncbi:MAG: hypothetical protein ACTSYI_14790 [Promethearchaeota archaeon]
MDPKELWLIFGGGKFGAKILKTFQSTTQIIIVDQDPQCEAAHQLSKDQIYPVSLDAENIVRIIKKTQTSLFFVGELPLVFSLWKALNPIYLIPMVPLHVMKEFGQIMIREQYHEISVSPGIIPTLNDHPTELNIMSPDYHTTYLSYAKFDEICPDNCLGKPGYCHYHKRNKPITVTDFVKENLRSQNHFNFESIQLAAGIGGIPKEQIDHFLSQIKDRLGDFNNYNSMTMLISTTCNCHGVISAIQLDKNNEK